MGNLRSAPRTLHYWFLAIGLPAVSVETQTPTISFALKLCSMLIRYINDTLLIFQGFWCGWCRVVLPPLNILSLTADGACDSTVDWLRRYFSALAARRSCLYRARDAHVTGLVTSSTKAREVRDNQGYSAEYSPGSTRGLYVYLGRSISNFLDTFFVAPTPFYNHPCKR